MLSWLIAAGFANVPALDQCAKQGATSLDATLAADLHTTYEVTRTDLRVCVDKAVYPYASGRGHKLLACYQVGLGKATTRFCGEGNSHADWRGYRVTVMLRTPRFTEACDVWLRVEKLPAIKT